MSDKILERILRKEREPEVETTVDDNEIVDFGAFGWLRGIRDRSIMIEFRLRQGDSTAFDYSWLRKVEFNPSDGIRLYFGSDSVVQVLGRNLNRPVRPTMQLLRGIHAHRVPWIQEASRAEQMQASDGATVVEEIRW